MPNYCKIIVAGHLGRDPEMKFLDNGTAIAKFSIAVTDKRSKEPETTWFDVSVFGKQAESTGQYLAKGRPALVEGRMRSRKYTAKDGSERTAWEVLADRVVFLGSRNDEQRESREPGDEAELGF